MVTVFTWRGAVPLRTMTLLLEENVLVASIWNGTLATPSAASVLRRELRIVLIQVRTTAGSPAPGTPLATMAWYLACSTGSTLALFIGPLMISWNERRYMRRK